MPDNTQQATVPKQFPMTDTSFLDSNPSDELDFETGFDDSGRLILKPKGNKVAPESDANVSATPEEVDDDDIIPDEKPTSTSTFSQQAYDNKIAALEEKLAQMAGYVQALLDREGGTSTQREQQDIEYDLNDPNSLRQMVKDTISQSMREQVSPLQGNLQNIELRIAYGNAVAQFGQDFQDRLPQIVTSMKSDPNLTFENAYLQLRGREMLSGGTTKGRESTSRGKQQLSAQQLAEKAKQLSTESKNGVGEPTPNGRNNGKFSSLKEAFESAFETHYGRG